MTSSSTLLEDAKITIPEVDLNDEASWPPVSFSAQVGWPRPGATAAGPTQQGGTA